MYKELVISIIIIIAIFSLDFVTQKYADKSIGEISTKLENLKGKIQNDNVNAEEANKEINDLYELWNKFHEKLAFYIEHDELEKVETQFTASKSLIGTKEYHFAIESIDKTIFILDHINDKYSFSLENIF